MTAVILPWILFFSLLLAVLLAFKRRWLLFLGCVILGCIVNWLGEIYPFNLNIGNKDADMNRNTFKVLAWNVDGSNKDSIKIIEIFNFIDSISPDVVFLSENYGQVACFLDKMLDSISLKRAYFPDDYGHCFYSRLPVKDVDVLIEECDSQAIMIKSTLTFKKKEIHLYGVHLSSNNYNSQKHFLPIDSIWVTGNVIDYIKNIRDASEMRGKEAELICNYLQKSKDPILVLGDMNDVNGSKCLRVFKNIGLKDAWWEGGVGYGATIHEPLPYRIDHILYSNQLKLNNVKVISSEGLSDHDAVFAELSY